MYVIQFETDPPLSARTLYQAGYYLIHTGWVNESPSTEVWYKAGRVARIVEAQSVQQAYREECDKRFNEQYAGFVL